MVVHYLTASERDASSKQFATLSLPSESDDILFIVTQHSWPCHVIVTAMSAKQQLLNNTTALLKNVKLAKLYGDNGNDW
jgi:hypothetical protein